MPTAKKFYLNKWDLNLEEVGKGLEEITVLSEQVGFKQQDTDTGDKLIFCFIWTSGI